MSTAVDRFLAVSRARLAPRTVDSYRRDLEDFEGRLGADAASASREQIEQYLADLRAAGRASSTVARRLAALRSFYRHQQLLAERPDNPAAEVAAPRRIRRLPRTLSAGEAERLMEAAAGTTPRALRDAALVELLYGAGLRVSEAVGLERGSVDLDERLVRCIGKGSKERIVPIGRRATDALRRYISRGRPYLDRRSSQALFLNARGGRLTRAGVFLILRRLAEKAGSSRSRTPASPPALLRHTPAGGRRRPAQRPGDARTRGSRHDRALHPCHGQAPPRDVFRGPPARETPLSRISGDIPVTVPGTADCP